MRTTDKSVTTELTVLANVTDNQARYRCEALNSATEIPLFETITLSVHCKLNKNNMKFYLSLSICMHSISNKWFSICAFFTIVAPETVRIHADPEELKPGIEATLICDSSSSNPPARVSWWKDGIPVEGKFRQMTYQFVILFLKYVFSLSETF